MNTVQQNLLQSLQFCSHMIVGVETGRQNEML